jgi:hypothetical protein
MTEMKTEIASRQTTLDIRLGMRDTMFLTGSNLRLLARIVASAESGRHPRTTVLIAGLAAAAIGWMSATASAQSISGNRYFPLDQTAPPAMAGQWAGVQPGFVPVIQPVRIDLGEQGGQVAFYSSPDGEATILPAPAVAGLRVGSVYRVKISDLRDFPAVELYPTVELIDRLHPPRGREVEFAIPIILTAEEIAAAVDGRLVTKVIYLEQPHREVPIRSTTASRVRRVPPRENALALADEAGRPMVIVRLGGRTPDAGISEPGFFGTCAPVQFYGKQPPTVEAARR